MFGMRHAMPCKTETKSYCQGMAYIDPNQELSSRGGGGGLFTSGKDLRPKLLQTTPWTQTQKKENFSNLQHASFCN